MNKVNILGGDKLPMYREGLNMIQEAAFMAAKMALLGGNNYILQGCQDDGNGNVSSGFVVVEGEILPFAAGALKTTITIKETRQSVNAFNVEYPEIPIHDHTSTAEFNKLSAKTGDIDEQASPGSVDSGNAAREYNIGGVRPKMERSNYKESRRRKGARKPTALYCVC